MFDNTDVICKCGKYMTFWIGGRVVSGRHGIQEEDIEPPQYKCDCGNRVYLEEKEPINKYNNHHLPNEELKLMAKIT